MSAVPLVPLLIDRQNGLAEFDAPLSSLARGYRCQVALLGLRRIGKAPLLDEVRRHPHAAIAYLSLDKIASGHEDFARAVVVSRGKHKQ